MYFLHNLYYTVVQIYAIIIVDYEICLPSSILSTDYKYILQKDHELREGFISSRDVLVDSIPEGRKREPREFSKLKLVVQETKHS